MSEKIMIMRIDSQPDFANTEGCLVSLMRPNKSLFGMVKISESTSKFTVSPDFHFMKPWPSHCLPGKPKDKKI